MHDIQINSLKFNLLNMVNLQFTMQHFPNPISIHFDTACLSYMVPGIIQIQGMFSNKSQLDVWILLTWSIHHLKLNDFMFLPLSLGFTDCSYFRLQLFWDMDADRRCNDGSANSPKANYEIMLLA